jgi:hypothetical protein
MKRVLPTIIITLVATGILSCTGCDFFNNLSGKKIEVVQKDCSYGKTLLFNGARSIVGIDPNLLEKRIELRFNTFVSYGALFSDGRLFVGDIGQSVGDFGGGIFVMDESGSLLKKIDSLPNPVALKIMDKYLFASGPIYYEDGLAGYNLFRLDTLEKVVEDKSLANFVGNNNGSSWNGILYIGVNGNELTKRSSYFLEKNSDTLEEKHIYIYTDANPYWAFCYLLFDNELVICYYHRFQVVCFNLNNDTCVFSQDLTLSIPELSDSVIQPTPDLPSVNQAKYSMPRMLIYNDALVFDLFSVDEDVNPYHALVYIDKHTGAFIKTINIDPTLSMGNFEYLVDGKAYFHYSDRITIIDAETGALIKEIAIDY